MRTHWHIVWLGLLVSMSAHTAPTYEPALTRCPSHDDELIARMMQTLDAVDEALPNVPPEEQRYLDAEVASALRVGAEEIKAGDQTAKRSSAMLDRLYARPLYRVWEVRKRIGPARDSISSVLERSGPITYKTNPEAEKLSRAATALTSVTFYQETVSKLMAAPHQEWTNTVPSNAFQSITESTFLTWHLGQFMNCKLANIMGRQSE